MPQRGTPLSKDELDADFGLFASMVEEMGPTVRDFQNAGGFSSTSVAAYHLHRLVDAGLIEHMPDGRTRPYRLSAAGRLHRQRVINAERAS